MLSKYKFPPLETVPKADPMITNKFLLSAHSTYIGEIFLLSNNSKLTILLSLSFTYILPTPSSFASVPFPSIDAL